MGGRGRLLFLSEGGVGWKRMDRDYGKVILLVG